MEIYLTELKNIIESSNSTIEQIDETSILIKNATKNTREKIHEFALKNKIYSQSFTNQDSYLKNTIVSINFIKPELNIDEFNKFFVDFYKYPIDVCKNKYFGYYMSAIKFLHPTIEEDYKEMFEILHTRFNGDLQYLKNHLQDVRKRMHISIRDNPEFTNFTQTKVQDLKKLPAIQSDLFVLKNANKIFVRFDIIKANFSLINKTNPNIFSSPDWETFVAKFTDLGIMTKSKILREIIFGELGVVKKVTTVGNDILATIYDKFKHYNPVIIAGDEIVFELDKCNCDEIYEFINMTWSGMFRMEKFVLSQYETKIENIFVEEYFDDTKSHVTKTKIRACPRKYLMQAVKYHQKKEIIDLDLKFVDNGMVATFDESIFFK